MLEIDKNFAAAANNLAWNYAEHGGDLDTAFSLAQKAREARPNDPSIADTLGWDHLKKKSYPTAIGLFRESSEKFKDSNPTGLYHLALAYDKNGDGDLAQQTLRKINAIKCEEVVCSAGWKVEGRVLVAGQQEAGIYFGEAELAAVSKLRFLNVLRASRLCRDAGSRMDVMPLREAFRIFKLLRSRDSSPTAQNEVTTQSALR